MMKAASKGKVAERGVLILTRQDNRSRQGNSNKFCRLMIEATRNFQRGNDGTVIEPQLPWASFRVL